MADKAQHKVPALVGMSHESIWGSCKVITPNLVKAYRKAYENKVNYFGYDEDMTSPEVIELARRILKTNPSRIVILDHMPHPSVLLHALDVIIGAENLPPVDFHLYGDFTLYTPEWIKIEILIKKMNFRFFCASPRQANFVKAMTKNFKNIHVCPFPVDTKLYLVSPKQRNMTRERFEIGKNDFLICYTGRLSFQKNSIRLCQEVVRLIKQNPDKNIKFLIAGTFDNMGAPFFGFYSKPGEYFERWSRWHQKLPKWLRARVIYVGQVGAEQLAEFYNASDLFVSLSTHHDEDYGMSPVEALFCGCPSVLSSWGGYEGFALRQDSCVTVPLKLESGTYVFSSQNFQDQMMRVLSLPAHLRKDRSSYYKGRFSIEAAAKILRNPKLRKRRKFLGWSKQMHDHAVRLGQMYQGKRVFEAKPNEKSFYYRIYKWYSKE